MPIHVHSIINRYDILAYPSHLLACFHIVVHSLNSPENLLVPEQVIAGPKDPYMEVVLCGGGGIPLWTLHPTVLED